MDSIELLSISLFSTKIHQKYAKIPFSEKNHTLFDLREMPVDEVHAGNNAHSALRGGGHFTVSGRVA